MSEITWKRPWRLDLKLFAGLLAATWSLVVVGLLVLEIHRARGVIYDVASAEAGAHFKQMVQQRACMAGPDWAWRFPHNSLS